MSKSNPNSSRRRKSIGMIVMLALGALIFSAVASNPAGATKPDPKHKVTICHLDGNSGKYSSPPVDVASVKFKGHNGHAGDIIPAFSMSEGYPFDYAGKNWNDAGKAIHANGCKVPVTPTTEPPPTTDTTATTETTLVPPTIIVCVQPDPGCTPKPPTPPPAPPAKPRKGHPRVTG